MRSWSTKFDADTNDMALPGGLVGRYLVQVDAILPGSNLTELVITNGSRVRTIAAFGPGGGSKNVTVWCEHGDRVAVNGTLTSLPPNLVYLYFVELMTFKVVS